MRTIIVLHGQFHQIVLRRATQDDAMTLAQTRQQVWEATYRGIYPDAAIDCFDFQWHAQEERRRLSRWEYDCELILDGEACVGYVAWGTRKEDAWRDFTFRLNSLYLLPEYQGVGLGRWLLNQVRAACRDQGCRKFYLDCHPANKKALGFYQHMGGVVTRVKARHHNPMEDSCIVEFYLN